MPSLSLGQPADAVPETFGDLLDALQRRAQPALVYYCDATERGGPDGPGEARVELSGRVLHNWAVKLIGLFDAEVGCQPGDRVLLDTRVHWKSAAALALGALGCEVHIGPGAGRAGRASADDSRGGTGDDAAPAGGDYALVVTDEPAAWLSSTALGDAELAALSPGMLDASFAEGTGVEVPSWVLDLSAEVRQQPDQLMVSLPEVSLPQPTATAGADPTAQGAGAPLALINAAHRAPTAHGSGTDPQGPPAAGAAGRDRAVVLWQTSCLPAMLATWAARLVVVCFDADPQGPESSALWESACRNEGIG